MAELCRDRYPAATAIGRRDGVRVLQVYALAARIAGLPSRIRARSTRGVIRANTVRHRRRSRAA